MSTTDEKQSTVQKSTVDHPLARVGMAPGPRIALVTGTGAFWGFTFGAFIGGRQAGLQYLAENAHRLPRTKDGWYFYHKTKNYRVLLGGIRQGMRQAGRMGTVCLVYSGLEGIMDRLRDQVSPIHSTLAGIITAGLFATITKLPRQSTRYALQIGFAVGLSTGCIDWIYRRFGNTKEETNPIPSTPTPH
jgi:hypothetical protein